MTPAQRAQAMALLDAAMAEVAQARLGGAAAPLAVDLHVAFVGAAEGPLAAQARATGGGRSVCFCEGEASDAGGRVVASALGTYRAVASG
jgi:acyl-coenzyme A thioesterase PaaI-like protein